MIIRTSTDSSFKAAGQRLKAGRLEVGIGSKWLKHAMAITHPEVLQHPDFVFDVEYGKIVIDAELEKLWYDTIFLAVNNPPQIDNPCDLCQEPTGSWLYDTCRPCVMQLITKPRLKCFSIP